jgi:tetratricopeptide (TPR) repeat protein
MPPSAPDTDTAPTLSHAVAAANAGDDGRALWLCQQLLAAGGLDPAVLQLLAVLSQRRGDAATALRCGEASLALRPDHAPTLAVTVDAARACGALPQARQGLQRLLALQPGQTAAWFQLALVCQDLGDLDAAAAALQRLLQLAPERADAAVNLGIVRQEQGRLAEAMQAYGHAYRLLPECFGRIAHALASAPCGALWLDLAALRQALADAAPADGAAGLAPLTPDADRADPGAQA